MSKAELNAWVNSRLESEVELTMLAGDAGFRRYYRVVQKEITSLGPLIAVDSPPESESNDAFLQVGEFLDRAELIVPRVHHASLDKGFFLLEDLGSEHLFDALNDESVSELYQKAISLLLHMSVLGRPAFIENYCEQKLLAEMELFPEWFLKQLVGQGVASYDMSVWKPHWSKLTAMLTESALAQPQAFVHRDFHSRNLLNTPEGSLGIIDFQDAVWGPLTYDLVSLLKDCYVRWPREKVVEWALDFHYHWQKIQAELDEGLGPTAADQSTPLTKEAFIRYFDFMGLQRHIKVLGIFSRLWIRDNKSGYLADLPRVLEYVIEVCGIYDELAFVLPLFDDLRGVMNQDSLRTLFHPYRH